MSAAPIQVLYILGAGHSGTTLLNLLLGAAEDTVALGEVKYGAWLMPGAPADADPASLRCDCGVHPTECELWGPTFDGLPPAGPSGFDDVELFARLARHTERVAGRRVQRLDERQDLGEHVGIAPLEERDGV